ncbi:MAG: hypothetical protein WDN00_17875 [Limisphaerales bacterium]
MKMTWQIKGFFSRVSLLFIFLGSVVSGMSHPDLIEQIDEITEQIGLHGPSADLLGQRADLYRRHAQFHEALVDIAAAERLETNSPAITLEKGAHLLRCRNVPTSIYHHPTIYCRQNQSRGGISYPRTL